MNAKSDLLIIFFCSALNNVELASASGRRVFQHSVQTSTSLALVSASNGSLQYSLWSRYINGSCLCPQAMTEKLNCGGGYVSSKVMCGCVTVNETEAVMTVGQCPYGCGYLNTAEDKYSNGLDLCKRFNRRGSLCSSCSAGYYPRLHSYDLHCVACTGVIVPFLWKYFVFVLLPLSIFYFVIVYLNLNILTSSFHGYIMFCQVLCSPMFSRVYLMKAEGSSRFVRMCMKFVLSACGIWSLDFFYFYDHKLCLRTNTLVPLALNYIVGVYPLLLMLATLGLTMLDDENFKLLVLAWKPFKCFFHVFKDNWDIKTSIVDTFVSFLIMCNVKFLGVCFDLLVPVRVYQYSPPGNVSSSWRLYYDAEVLYFGRDHLPYAVLALGVFSIFIMLPLQIFICGYNIINTIVNLYKSMMKAKLSAMWSCSHNMGSHFLLLQILSKTFADVSTSLASLSRHIHGFLSRLLQEWI